MAEEEKKKDEPKKSRREVMYGDKKKPAKEEAKAEPAKAEEPAEPDGEGGEAEAANPQMDAMKDAVKRHEKDRRDLHGSHREEHRKMADRHMSELKALGGKMTAAGEEAPEEQAPAEAAEG